jgi:hypothetical protein
MTSPSFRIDTNQLKLETKTRVCLSGMYQAKQGLKIGQSLIFLWEIFLQAGKPG